MLDLKFVRENPEVVKQNIRNKFQDAKLPMVDEVIELDAKNRAAKAEADSLRASRNKLSQQAVQADRSVNGPGQEGRGRSCESTGNCQCKPSG